MPTFLTLYDTVLARLKIIEPTASFNVTHKTFTLGDTPDADTGQYPVSFSAGATIEMLIVSKAANATLEGTGIWIRTDATGLTKTSIAEQDRISLASGLIYVAETVKQHPIGDKTIVYEAQLALLPYTEAP